MCVCVCVRARALGPASALKPTSLWCQPWGPYASLTVAWGVSGRNAGVEEGAVAMKTQCPLQGPALSSIVTFLSLCPPQGSLV